MTKRENAEIDEEVIDDFLEDLRQSGVWSVRGRSRSPVVEMDEELRKERTMTKRADAELKEWLDTIPDEFLACRDVRHAWGGEHRFWSLQISKLGLVRGRTLVCARCGAAKHQIMHNGVIIKSRMSYPTDYTKPSTATAGRVAPREFRVRLSEAEVTDSSSPPPATLAAMLERMKGK